MPLAAHTMPNNDEEVRAQVKAVFGFEPCLWQIQVVCAVLAGEDVITIARTGSGKSITYWMPALFIKYGIIIVVTPLSLLGAQFVQMLKDNGISAICIPAADATNEVFEVTHPVLHLCCLDCSPACRTLPEVDIKLSQLVLRYSTMILILRNCGVQKNTTLSI